MRPGVEGALRDAVARLLPGARLVSCAPLGADRSGGASRKDAGYSQPLRLDVEEADGSRRTLVFRTASTDEFGHDRRADRVAELLLAFDTFDLIPGHVRALDAGCLAPEGLRSLRGAGEPYLLTTFAEGTLYADDLRRVATAGRAGPEDLARCEALAGFLAGLHRDPLQDEVVWRRAARDLVGAGEGIFGVVDAYPPGVEGAPAERLQAIERRCLAWRWRLKARPGRLRRTHGDFHPFNVVFGEGAAFTLLDASRGGRGEPADDVAALAVNYPFFALERRSSWRDGLGPLWRRFWQRYLELTADVELLELAAPFLAWRLLVVACPRFYPALPAAGRDALLSLAERALDAPRFDPAMAEELFP